MVSQNSHQSGGAPPGQGARKWGGACCRVSADSHTVRFPTLCRTHLPPPGPLPYTAMRNFRDIPPPSAGRDSGLAPNPFNANMALPFSNIRVVDLSTVIAGPYCSHHLALMGADVVKVEIPQGGDIARRQGADSKLNAIDMGASYLALSAGKRSITLNLKHEAGKEILLRLLGKADVLLENFRPGVMTRLGLDYEALKPKFPGLIYCAISGFGQDGPYREKPALDQIIQGMSGAMSTTGHPESGPVRVGYPVSDTVAGLNAAFAIAAALFRREGAGREGGEGRGEGEMIDVSMLDSTLSIQGWALSNYLIGGQVATPFGNDNVLASPSGSFQARDALINIGANSQQQYETLCRVLGREELIGDVRFSTIPLRLDNRAALKEELERSLGEADGASWIERLTAAGVPAGPVLDLAQALALPPVVHRGSVRTLQDVPGVERPVDVFTAGYRLSGGAPQVGHAPPRLGGHTGEVLGELGYTPEEIERFREAGAV